jgi:LysM repeat protein
MKIELHALLLASGVFFVGAQASANQTAAIKVATLQTQPTVSRDTGTSISINEQCLALSQNWNQANQSILGACLRQPGISIELKQKLERLAQASTASQPQIIAQVDPLTLESLQRQINALKDQINLLESVANTSAAVAKQREQQLEQTVESLTAEVESLRDEVGSVEPSIASTDSLSSTTPPPFKPTISFGGSANLLYGGIDGEEDSAGRFHWKQDISKANQDFDNQSFSETPLHVTGATNRAGGKAYRYYFSGQSEDTFPPNGLKSVNEKQARAYAMSSSWTGGKVRLSTIQNGGDLIISDKDDPNYNKTDPRSLDYGANQIIVDFKGTPVIPNVGLGGLKNPADTGKSVKADDFKINNLGNEFTLNGISLSRNDVQNLIDLGNASRRVKGVKNNMDIDYLVGSGETISTIAFKYGTTSSKLLAKNPGLGQKVSSADVLKQGIELKVPTNLKRKLTIGDNLVSPGGLVDNKATYDDLLNLAVAEYGSLTDKQRNKIENTAQRFISGLAKSEPGTDPTKINNNFMRAYTFNHDVKLNLSASLWGDDMLRITLRHRNYLPYGDRANFPAANLAFGFGGIDNSELTFDRLWWKLPVSDTSSFWVGTRLKDYHFLPVRYGTFYPVEQQNYFFATSAGMHDYVGSGVGFTANNLVDNFLGGSLSFGTGYLANSRDAINPVTNAYQEKGFIGRDTRFRVPVQLGYNSDDGNVIASINYIFGSGDTLNSFVGTTLSKDPFFYDTDQFSQLGLSFGWQFAENVSLNAAYNEVWYNARYDTSVLGVQMVEEGDTARARSWMAALLFDDILFENSKIGLAVGNVPHVYENSSAWGTDDAPLAFETWLNWDVSDYISVQPGVFFLTNSDGLDDGGTDWGMTFRTYLKF